MPPEALRWIPLAVVALACGFVWHGGRGVELPRGEEAKLKLLVPAPPDDYTVPGEVIDPFLPRAGAPAPAAAKAAPAKPKPPRDARLDGIFWSDTMPLASINGHLLGKGESAGGVTVVEIEPTAVTLRLAGKLVTKRLEVVR